MRHVISGFFRCLCGKLHSMSCIDYTTKCPSCKRNLGGILSGEEDFKLETIVRVNDERFDIRNCPIWAIPLLAFVKREFKREDRAVRYLSFTQLFGRGLAVVHITGYGYRYFWIDKSDMNKPTMPELNYPS